MKQFRDDDKTILFCFKIENVVHYDNRVVDDHIDILILMKWIVMMMTITTVDALNWPTRGDNEGHPAIRYKTAFTTFPLSFYGTAFHLHHFWQWNKNWRNSGGMLRQKKNWVRISTNQHKSASISINQLEWISMNENPLAPTSFNRHQSASIISNIIN